MPALIRKFHNAKINNKKTVEVWGTGVAKRGFLHVDDLAEAILFCLKKNIYEDYLNVGTKNISWLLNIRGSDASSSPLTNGKILFNKKYPDGTKERKLDITLIKKYGWLPKISFKKGLHDYYEYFKRLKLKN